MLQLMSLLLENKPGALMRVTGLLTARGYNIESLTVARTLGLPDQTGRSTIELLVRFFGDKTILLVLDNCEHLLDACGSMVTELLSACPNLTILTTSREPLAVPAN